MSSRNEMGGLKRLVLGGAVGSLSVLSGCDTPRQFGLGAGLFGLGYLYQKGREINTAEENSKRESEAIKEAARIQAEAMGNAGGANGRDKNFPEIHYFTCTGIVDLNNDGNIEINSSEIINKGKTEFRVGETVHYMIVLGNCKGKTLEFYEQTDNGGKLELLFSNVIPRNSCNKTVEFNFKRPGRWQTYFMIDGVKVADYNVSAK